MACFWIAIEKATRNLISGTTCKTPEDIATFVKSKNQKTPEISINGNKLSDQEQNENFDHCRSYDVKTVFNGYDCSTSDPFLCLIATIYNVNISHNFNGITILYSIPTPSTTIHFHSNTGHFWH